MPLIFFKDKFIVDFVCVFSWKVKYVQDYSYYVEYKDLWKVLLAPISFWPDKYKKVYIWKMYQYSI